MQIFFSLIPDFPAAETEKDLHLKAGLVFHICSKVNTLTYGRRITGEMYPTDDCFVPMRFPQ